MILILMACADPAPLDTQAPELEGPDYVDPGGEASWTAEEARAALEAAAAGQLPDPEGLSAVLDSWMVFSEPGCPGGSGGLFGGESINGCTTSDGYVYSGIAGWTHDEAEGLESIGIVLEVRLEDPTGTDVFSAGAEWGWVASTADGSWIFTVDLNGSVIQESHDSEWLSNGVSSYLTMEGVGSRLEDGVAVGNVRLDGGLSMGETALHFDDLGLAMPDCAGVATGTVAIRDPSEGWWRFDHGDCDQCVLTYNDEVVDGSCPDLETLGPRLVDLYVP